MFNRKKTRPFGPIRCKTFLGLVLVVRAFFVGIVLISSRNNFKRSTGGGKQGNGEGERMRVWKGQDPSQEEPVRCFFFLQMVLHK